MRVFGPAIKRLWSMFDAHEKRLGFGVLFVMLLASASSVLMVGSVMPFLFVLSNPGIIDTHWFFRSFSDYFGGLDSQVMIVLLGFAVFLAVVLSNLIGLLKVYVLARYTQMRGLSLSKQMFEIQMHQPYEKFAQTQPGVFMRRCVSEPVQAVTGFLMPFAEGVAAAMTACFMIAFLAWYNLSVTMGVIGFMLIAYFAMVLIIGRRLKVAGQTRVQAVTNRTQVVQEVFRCFRDIRMSSQERAFHKRFSDVSMEAMKTQILSSFWAGFPRHWIQILFFGSIVFGCTVLILTGGSNTQVLLLEYLPTIGVFVLAGQRILPEIQTIYNARNKMSFGMASVEALFEALDEASEFPEPIPPLRSRLVPEKTIVLEDVAYKYPDSNIGLVSPFNLTIQVGEHVGIVGKSGSGKSTLASLLMGLIGPQEGRLVVDGESVDRSRLSDWSAAVAQVPQEVMLLSTNIRGNIAIGVEPSKIDDEQVWDALEKAQLADWVRTLPHGLDSEVMSGAALVSGGQKQRIGLARAFFRDASVIILDEATSALDDKTEGEILVTLEEQLKGKTSISIAHRLTTLRMCSRIIEMDAGKIIFDGSWEQFKAQRSNFSS